DRATIDAGVRRRKLVEFASNREGRSACFEILLKAPVSEQNRSLQGDPGERGECAERSWPSEARSSQDNGRHCDPSVDAAARVVAAAARFLRGFRCIPACSPVERLWRVLLQQ